MALSTIQDWTESQVLLKFNEARDVKYRVYRRWRDNVPGNLRSRMTRRFTYLELPNDMKLDREQL